MTVAVARFVIEHILRVVQIPVLAVLPTVDRLLPEVFLQIFVCAFELFSLGLSGFNGLVHQLGAPDHDFNFAFAALVVQLSFTVRVKLKSNNDRSRSCASP